MVGLNVRLLSPFVVPSDDFLASTQWKTTHQPALTHTYWSTPRPQSPTSNKANQKSWALDAALHRNSTNYPSSHRIPSRGRQKPLSSFRMQIERVERISLVRSFWQSKARQQLSSWICLSFYSYITRDMSGSATSPHCLSIWGRREWSGIRSCKYWVLYGMCLRYTWIMADSILECLLCQKRKTSILQTGVLAKCRIHVQRYRILELCVFVYVFYMLIYQQTRQPVRDRERMSWKVKPSEWAIRWMASTGFEPSSI